MKLVCLLVESQIYDALDMGSSKFAKFARKSKKLINVETVSLTICIFASEAGLHYVFINGYH